MHETVTERLVNRIIYNAPVDWTEQWLNLEMTNVFDSFPLHGKSEVIPFFNELAHYACDNIATADGHLPMNHVGIMVEECLDVLQTKVWDEAHNRLTNRHGPPKDSIDV